MLEADATWQVLFWSFEPGGRIKKFLGEPNKPYYNVTSVENTGGTVLVGFSTDFCVCPEFAKPSSKMVGLRRTKSHNPKP